MKILPLSFDRPELNLAFEDWFFEHFEEETLRIWRSSPSVVVGKHQNALAECNFHFCRNSTIPVIRRISGGGTVYHDLGNINFSFFRFTKKERLIDYDQNLGLIIHALAQTGYTVNANSRHDLFSGLYKVSGNAQHISKGRALHHGTILYDSDLSVLRNAIKRTKGLFKDKSVKSVRSEIVNLREIQDSGNIEEFELQLVQALQIPGNEMWKKSAFSMQPIQDLANSKYQNNEWNFGYGPAYSFSNEKDELSVKIEVERGRKIIKAEVFKESAYEILLSDVLIGAVHDYDIIFRLLQPMEYPKPMKEKLLELLF